MKEELNAAARNYAAEFIRDGYNGNDPHNIAESFKDGAKWALSALLHIIEKDDIRINGSNHLH